MTRVPTDYAANARRLYTAAQGTAAHGAATQNLREKMALNAFVRDANMISQNPEAYIPKTPAEAKAKTERLDAMKRSQQMRQQRASLAQRARRIRGALEQQALSALGTGVADPFAGFTQSDRIADAAEQKYGNPAGYSVMPGVVSRGGVRAAVVGQPNAMPASSWAATNWGQQQARLNDHAAALDAGQISRNAIYDQQQLQKNTPEIIAARAARARETYGGANGLGGLNSRESLVNARTDLTDEQKAEFLARGSQRENRLAQAQALRQQLAMGEHVARRQRIADRYAPVNPLVAQQQAMLAQAMQRDPQVAVQLMALQEQGRQANMGMMMDQQRLGMSGRELDLREMLGMGDLGLRQGQLDLNSELGTARLANDQMRMANEAATSQQELALRERLGMQQNQIAQAQLDQQGSQFGQELALRQQEVANRPPSEAEMVAIDSLAGSLVQSQGIDPQTAYTMASAQIRGTGSAAASPQSQPPMQQPQPTQQPQPVSQSQQPEDPIEIEARRQKTAARLRTELGAPQSDLSRTFAVFGFDPQNPPQALDIADALVERVRKGETVTARMTSRLREYIQMQAEVDPSFLESPRDQYSSPGAYAHQDVVDPDVDHAELMKRLKAAASSQSQPGAHGAMPRGLITAPTY